MATVLVVVLAGPLVRSQQKLDIDPLELVRGASQNEIKANDAEHYFMFRDTIDYKDHSVSHEDHFAPTRAACGPHCSSTASP